MFRADDFFLVLNRRQPLEDRGLVPPDTHKLVCTRKRRITFLVTSPYFIAPRCSNPCKYTSRLCELFSSFLQRWQVSWGTKQTENVRKLTRQSISSDVQGNRGNAMFRGLGGVRVHLLNTKFSRSGNNYCYRDESCKTYVLKL